MKRVIAALIVIAFAGCSVITVRGPDIAPGTMPPLGQPIECTDSRGAPIFDIVMAGLFLLVGIGALIDANSSESRPHSARVAVATLPSAILFAISAGFGLDRVGECERVRELYMR